MPAATSTSPRRSQGRERGRRALQSDDLGLVQLTGQEQVVRAARTDRNPLARAVHLGVLGERRGLRNEVAALDQHVRGGEPEALATGRIDGEEADVGLFAADRLDRRRRLLEHHQLDRQPKPAGEFTGQIDRDANRVAAGRRPVGQDRVADVDGGPQGASWRERLDQRGSNGLLRSHEKNLTQGPISAGDCRTARAPGGWRRAYALFSARHRPTRATEIQDVLAAQPTVD